MLELASNELKCTSWFVIQAHGALWRGSLGHWQADSTRLTEYLATYDNKASLPSSFDATGC
jgi:hypothetical protein